MKLIRNQRPKDPVDKIYYILCVMRIRGKREPEKRMHGQWFHANGEIIFQSCFKCIYKVFAKFYPQRKAAYFTNINRTLLHFEA